MYRIAFVQMDDTQHLSGVVSQTAGATVLGGSMRDRLPRMIGSIAANTIGSELEEQMQSQSQSTGTSALYGPRGNVDDLVAQSGYAPDPGKQFAWSANAGMGWDNGGATVDSPYSPDVNGYAVPYPANAASALPEQMGSGGVQTAAVADGLEAGAGYSFYPVGADGIAHMPTIVVRPSNGTSAIEDPELIVSQQAIGLMGGLGVSALKTVNAGVNLIADAVLLRANQLSFGLLQNTSLVREANQQMGELADALRHPFNTARAMWQNEAGLASAVGSRLAAGDNIGAGLAGGEVFGDLAQLAVPALGVGKVGLMAAERWVAPVANDAIQSYVRRTGVALSAMPSGEGISAVGVDGATESVSIGNSGYRSIGEFTDAVTAKYQALYDQGYATASDNASQGLIPNTARAIDSDADAFARVGLRDWLTNAEGIAEGPGELVQVNRRLYDPSGSGAYRVLDVYIPGSQTILDGSISFKTGTPPQVIDFGKFSGGEKPPLSLLRACPGAHTASREMTMARFPFSDLHSFKDYVIFVRMCAPNQFPLREGVLPEDQWTLELAFRGLKKGLLQAIKEKGQRDEFDQCWKLVDEAYAHYEEGRRKEGFMALDQVHKLLRKIRTH